MISAIVSFDEKLKFAVHIAQICCIIVAIGLSIGRFTITSPPPSRANMVSITLGIKSFIVIGYQLLTEHTDRFRKWASTKANAILNALEIVFWLAVLVVTGKGLGRSSGSAAAVEAFILIMAIILEILCIWMAGCSIKVHRRAKMFRSNFGVATATPTYPQTMHRSHGYPPSSMQERK